MSQNTILTILGMKGSGKTTLTKQIITEHSRVVILDANGEYDAARVVWGFQECVNALVEHEHKRSFRLSLRCYRVKETLRLMGLCYHFKDAWIVIDEASLYCSPVSIPDEVSRLVRFGRHRRLSLIFVARRASEIPRDITANSDLLITFKQTEPRDLLYLQSFHHDAERVRHLKPYRFKVFGDAKRSPLCVLERREERD